MGVYISNETMPEDCYTCFCYETEFDMCSLTGKRLDNIRIGQDDCPLIEIDLERDITDRQDNMSRKARSKRYMKGFIN